MQLRRLVLSTVCLASSGAVALAGAGIADALPSAHTAPSAVAPRSSEPDLTPREAVAADRARDAARANAPLVARDALVVKDAMLDRDGASHVRFKRTYAGLPVVGADLVVHQDARGRFVSISGPTPRLSLPTRAQVTRRTAVRTATEAVRFPRNSVRSELVVLSLGRTPELAWQVDVRGTRADGSPAGQHVFVAARGPAEVVRQWSSVPSETGVGHSLYSGTVQLDTVLGSNGIFSMVEPLRGAGRTVSVERFRLKLLKDGDNEWGDGTTADPQTVAVDAHFGAAVTWDYYLDRFGRVGIRDNGVGARSVVHAGRFTNAYWLGGCFCMVYGDGSKRDGTTPLVTLDIAGHEMTHGVTFSTADLFYFGQSGGLNEATSDIMGTNVEFAAGNTDPGTDLGDYLIGEEIFLDADPTEAFFRRMDHPSLDGYSQDCVNRRTKRIDVHYSSGPANHFYYLLAEGSGAKTINGVDYDSPTCNNSEVDGIGREKAEQIWYRGLTTYMTPRTGYRGAKRATTQAARDLYGVNSVEAVTVKAAWAAVAVG